MTNDQLLEAFHKAHHKALNDPGYRTVADSLAAALRGVIETVQSETRTTANDEFIRAAVEEWHHGQLPAVTSLWVIYLSLHPAVDLTSDDITWARGVIEKRMEANRG